MLFAHLRKLRKRAGDKHIAAFFRKAKLRAVFGKHCVGNEAINEGTGGRIRRVYKITADMGGKTGTTQNNSDGWFMGFTPSLVTGCWVGGEERDIHFDKMSDGQGASMALPIWGLYMNKVYDDKTLPYSQDEEFEIPVGWDACRGYLFTTTEEGDTVMVDTPVITVPTNTSDGFDDLFQ